MSVATLPDGREPGGSGGGGGVPGGGGGVLAALAGRIASAELGALFALAAASALGVGLILWSLRPGWVPVAERGGRESALAVTELLAGSGIEHRLEPTTGLVLVPESRLGEVRAHLAAAGLEGEAGVGLEMLAEPPALGTSQFTETRRYRHALETELARTLSGMRGVETARVHLALPDRSVFVRDREAASASVMVRPEPGRSLDDEQVESIRRLVAAGIPYLEPDGVTVVDRWGQLLSGDDGLRGASRERFGHARRIERLYAERIESLLAPLVGPGRVRASVTAEIDFSEEERTAERFDADPAKLRSEQVDDSRESVETAGGVPGSLVNQPPAAGGVDPADDPDALDGAPDTKVASTSATRNYELDRTISHVRLGPGDVRRVSAAVVVDDAAVTAEDGTETRRPLTDDELAELTSLVREAIGFDAARGDSVTVANRAFLPETPLEPLPETPLWEQPWLAPLVRDAGVGLAVLLLVWIGVRPALSRLLGSGGGAGGAAGAKRAALTGPGDRAPDASRAGTGASALAGPERAAAHGDILATARALAADDPKRIARLVKDWVAEP